MFHKWNCCLTGSLPLLFDNVHSLSQVRPGFIKQLLNFQTYSATGVFYGIMLEELIIRVLALVIGTKQPWTVQNIL